ncbi:MAG: type IV pilus assembly protein PilM [Gemmatimonadetes bacterium]|nr:type IV pilus assembly protein PilM [Gemmatimonadota bacterium]MYE17620.1 type IV pilus assembly protein PilM [Gemmatimonadota bacterium]
MGIFGRKKTTVGLDIGSAFVKLVEIDHMGDRPELRRIMSRPIPPGAVVDGEVTNRELLSDAVRALLEAAALQSRDVITALGGHDVFVKKVELTRVPHVSVRDLIAREAQRRVPFDLQSVHLDYQTLGPTPPDGSMEALLVAAKKERVQARISLLEDAGAAAALLDVEALALCNALCHNYRCASEGVVALVNLGYEVTNIVILEDGIPALIRDLPLGLRRFGELLQRVHGLPVELVEEVIQGRGDLQGLDRAVETGADVIAVGIERACAFLGSRRPGGGLGRVFLSGGGACLAGVTEALGHRMKVDTRVANPCERVAVAPGLRGRSALSGAAPLFFQAIGLALRNS